MHAYVHWIDRAYVGYQNEASRDERYTSWVTDISVSGGADGDERECQRVILEKVPLTELSLVSRTPTRTLAQLRKNVRKSTTTRDMIGCAFEAFAGRPCLGQELVQGVGDFRWLTYAEIHRTMKRVERALLSLGVSRGSFVGMCAHNSVAHVQVQHATCNLGSSNNRRRRR